MVNTHAEHTMPEQELKMQDHYYDAYCLAFNITDGQIDYDSDRWTAFILGLTLAA
jgi:hypothetical protein